MKGNKTTWPGGRGTTFAVKAASLIAVVAAIGLLGIGLDGGWQATRTQWPGLHEDGSKFSTIIINRAAGLGNKFDVFTRQIRVANGDYNFNDHGQLYYPVIAALMRGADYGALLRTLHLTNLAGFLLSFLLFLLVAWRRVGCRLEVALLYATAGALATAGILQYLLGRPDHGIVLALLLFGLASELIFRGRQTPQTQTGFWWAVGRGLQIGVVGAISPFPGYLLGVCAVYAEALEASRWQRLIGNALISMAAALLCWAGLTTIVYPGPLTDLFVRIVGDGTRHHEGLSHLYYNFPHFNPARFSKSWVTLKFAPFLILPLLLAAAQASFLSWRRLWSGGSLVIRLLVAVLLIVLPGQLWFFVVHWPEINYSLLGLYPTIFLWSLRQAGRVGRGPGLSFHLAERERQLEFNLAISPLALRNLLVLLCAATLILPGAGYVRTSLLQRPMIEHGVSYEAALERYQELKRQLRPDEYILIREYTSGNARSAVIFDGPPWRARASFVEDDLNRQFTNLKGRYYFVIQDALSDVNVPERIGGYRLIEKRLTPTPVIIFGRRLAAITPGYGYLVYELEREESAASKASAGASATAREIR